MDLLRQIGRINGPIGRINGPTDSPRFNLERGFAHQSEAAEAGGGGEEAGINQNLSGNEVYHTNS